MNGYEYDVIGVDLSKLNLLLDCDACTAWYPIKDCKIVEESLREIKDDVTLAIAYLINRHKAPLTNGASPLNLNR